MLGSIISSKAFPAFISIQDDYTSRGVNLLKGILKLDIENKDIRQIHMICLRNPPEFYFNSFDMEKVITHNLFNDPCGWIESNTFDCDALFEKILCSQELQSTIVIDCINPIILLKDINYVCKIIYKLKARFKKVVCLIQGDTVSDTDCLKKLSFFSNIFLKVHQNFSKSILCSSNKHYLGVEEILKKPSGKVVVMKEIYKVDDNFAIQSERYDDKKRQNDNKSNAAPNMKGLTTFRIGLDMQENEKIARDNLILPYLRTANKKHGYEEKKTGGSIVYYEEPGDDLEEDPDDDLDI